MSDNWIKNMNRDHDLDKINWCEIIVPRDSLYGIPLDISEIVKKEAITVLNFPQDYPKINKSDVNQEIYATTFPKDWEEYLNLDDLYENIEPNNTK